MDRIVKRFRWVREVPICSATIRILRVKMDDVEEIQTFGRCKVLPAFQVQVCADHPLLYLYLPILPGVVLVYGIEHLLKPEILRHNSHMARIAVCNPPIAAVSVVQVRRLLHRMS